MMQTSKRNYNIRLAVSINKGGGAAVLFDKLVMDGVLKRTNAHTDCQYEQLEACEGKT